MNEELWQQLELKNINDLAQELLGRKHYSFSECAKSLMSGDFDGAFQMIKDMCIDMFLPGVAEGKNLFLGLLFLGLLGVLLQYTFGIVKNKQVADMAYYFVYLLLVLMLLEGMGQMTETAGEMLDLCKEFIVALIPAFCLSVSFAVGTASAAVNYELLLLLLMGIDYILAGLMLPLIRCYGFLVIMDGLDEKHRMREFVKLTERGISYGIKISLTVTLMVSGMQNLVTSKLDGIQKTAVQKAIGVIPGIGDMSESVTEVLLGSAGLIKNSVGITAMIFIFLIVLRPVFRVLCMAMAMKLAGACIRFMGQGQLSDTVSKMGEGGLLMMRAVICGVIAFWIVVAMTMFVGRGGV